MRRPHLRAAVPLVAAALVAAGCGAGKPPSDAQRVERTLHDYLRLQHSGEPAQACALLSAAGQRQLVGFVAREARARSLPIGSLTCEGAIDAVRLVAGEQTLTELEGAAVVDVRVSGGRASAEVRDGSIARRAVVQLVKVGGDWKVSAVPGLGG